MGKRRAVGWRSRARGCPRRRRADQAHRGPPLLRRRLLRGRGGGRSAGRDGGGRGRGRRRAEGEGRAEAHGHDDVGRAAEVRRRPHGHGREDAEDTEAAAFAELRHTGEQGIPRPVEGRWRAEGASAPRRGGQAHQREHRRAGLAAQDLQRTRCDDLAFRENGHEGGRRRRFGPCRCLLRPEALRGLGAHLVRILLGGAGVHRGIGAGSKDRRRRRPGSLGVARRRAGARRGRVETHHDIAAAIGERRAVQGQTEFRPHRGRPLAARR
mmetsp:Transcript_38671/g.111732  ORF Transcript_38671/g.111732 Transcript_38671/m.111732 type:complete len:268 (+) Transcript_38671:346-1149(+)